MRHARFIAALACALLSAGPTTAENAPITCTGQEGASLIIDPAKPRVVRVSEDGAEKALSLISARICFACVGVPVLEVNLADGKDKVFARGEARRCGEADDRRAEGYCVAAVGIQFGSRSIRHCAFPQGTSVGSLWRALTGQVPPEGDEPWWGFRD